jgi:hypothetical protein
MPRRGDYLFKRKGSQNWWLRLQFTDGARVSKIERSMGTPDRAEARLKAADLIKAHQYESGSRVDAGYAQAGRRQPNLRDRDRDSSE